MKDITDLSGRTHKYISFVGLPRTEKFKASYKNLRDSAKGIVAGICFPPDTKGFFYFCDRTSINPLAGDLRFRVLPQDAIDESNSANGAELFARGHDLLNYDGTEPWGSSLSHIIYQRRMGLYPFMKMQGLIADEAELRIQRLKLEFAAKGVSLYRIAPRQVLDQVTSPFVVDLTHYEQRIMILHKEDIVTHRFRTRGITVKKPPHGSSFSWHPPSYSGESSTRLCLDV